MVAHYDHCNKIDEPTNDNEAMTNQEIKEHSKQIMKAREVYTPRGGNMIRQGWKNGRCTGYKIGNEYLWDLVLRERGLRKD